jgi:hypothetical protein
VNIGFFSGIGIGSDCNIDGEFSVFNNNCFSSVGVDDFDVFMSISTSP